MTEKKVEYSDEYDTNNIKCPSCGGDYLHQVGVELVIRDEEDGPASLVEATKDGVSVKRMTAKEAYIEAGRRDLFKIIFNCEECSFGPGGNSYGLWIKQHKGITIMEWA